MDNPSIGFRQAPETGIVLIGKQIGPYRILSRDRLADTRYFYKATHVERRETIALLFLKRPLQEEDPGESQFLQKLSLFAALDHSNLARLFPIETHEGHQLLPMEFTHGKTLAEMIGAGPCDFDLALQTAIQATRALLEVHESGLIHGRLTSRSLLLQEGNQLKLLDVVLPYLPQDLVLHDPEEPESQGPDLPGGQPPLLHLSYRAPEQVRGEPADARTDLFSLGAVLYELSLGEFLFAGRDAVALDRQIQDRELPKLISVRPQASPGWSRLLRALLQKEPADRYPSAYELLSDLEKLNYGFSLDTLSFRPTNPRLSRRGFFKSFTGDPEE